MFNKLKDPYFQRRIKRIFGPLLVWYGASYYCFKHPEKLEGIYEASASAKKLKIEPIVVRSMKSRYIIAHRGGSGEEFENTLTAFKKSIDKGVDIIETDVRMTSDGVMIVAHDPGFDRICNKSTYHEEMGPTISTTNSKHLPKFTDVVPVDFSFWLSYE